MAFLLWRQVCRPVLLSFVVWVFLTVLSSSLSTSEASNLSIQLATEDDLQEVIDLDIASRSQASGSSSVQCRCSSRRMSCQQQTRMYRPAHLTYSEPNYNYQGRQSASCCKDLTPPCVPILPMPTAVDTEKRLRQAVNSAVQEVVQQRKDLEQRIKDRQLQQQYVSAVANAPFAPAPFAASSMAPTGIAVPPVAALNIKGVREGLPVDVDMYLDSRGSVVPDLPEQPQMTVKNSQEMQEAKRRLEEKKQDKEIAHLEKQLQTAKQLREKLHSEVIANVNANAQVTSTSPPAPAEAKTFVLSSPKP